MRVRQRPPRGAPGQHFLRSSRLVADLVRDAGVQPGDLVLDIGAGPGAITSALAAAHARVLAVELDPGLAAVLRRRFADREVDVVEGDVLSLAWPREPFAVVANLPFAGSREILSSLLRDPRTPLERAHVIVQWEAAQKQAAVWPATLRATYWRAWYELAVVGRLSRYAFSPPPNVEGAVLRISRRRVPLVAAEQHAEYRRFLSDAFAAPEPLTRALRGRVSPRELRRLAAILGFDPGGSARDLDARQWSRVFAFVRR